MAGGEGLFGVFSDEEVVGVGGLTLDPFVREGDIGRLRRIYVRSRWRRRGIGEALVKTMLGEAATVFRRVRLQAENEGAARLYERFGFVRIADEHATHLLVLREEER